MENLLSAWPEGTTGSSTIFCPCLVGLPPDLAPTLAALPIHDANAALLSGLATPTGGLAPDYAGVFFADPFRKLDDILDQVRAAKIGGVVNLPSVAGLLDKSPDEGFARIYRREMDGLSHARKRGFRILCVIPDHCAADATQTDLPSNCPTILASDIRISAHDGPRRPSAFPGRTA